MEPSWLERVDFEEYRFDSLQGQPLKTASKSAGTDLVVFDRFSAYLFFDESLCEVHRYKIPDDSDILNCGGYLDKLAKYRSSQILDYLNSHGISKSSFLSASLPLLRSRSALIDLDLLNAVTHLKEERPTRRISVLDVGCTVCEHWDFINQLIRSTTANRCGAEDWLYWHGTDLSPLVLLAAALTHASLTKEQFKVEVVGGVPIQVEEGSYDITLCIGVMHNFKDPLEGLRNLVRAAKVATLIALWVGDLSEGVWLISHHSTPFFLFGKTDLKSIIEEFPEKTFLVSDFIPENLSTQNRHFVNLNLASLDSIGSYHLIVTPRPDFFPGCSQLVL